MVQYSDSDEGGSYIMNISIMDIMTGSRDLPTTNGDAAAVVIMVRIYTVERKRDDGVVPPTFDLVATNNESSVLGTIKPITNTPPT